MVTSDRPPANGFVAAARKVYNPIGFAKGYNFVLWFIFLGALLGFTLARLQFLDFYNVFCPADGVSRTGSTAGPGECFYWRQGYYTVGVIMHLAGILPAALLACVQFVPVVRHRAIMVHRVNGYVVVLLSLVATAGAFMLLNKSFGGGVDIQIVGGVLGVSFVIALVLAYVNIKRLQIDQHRAWMLRAWFWAGSIITLRLIQIIVISILPLVGTVYVAQPCDKINYTLLTAGPGTKESVLASYPDCAADRLKAFYSGNNTNQWALVEANFPNAQDAMQVAAALDSSFGGAMFLAFAMHALGVELYLRLTPAESERLRQVSYKRQLEAGMKNPGRAGLTVDRLGDAPKWESLKQNVNGGESRQHSHDGHESHDSME